MTLDGLVEFVPNDELDPERKSSFNHYVVNCWATSNEPLERLTYLGDKWLGNVWMKHDADHELFFQHWTAFKTQAIDRIEGMTMLERLVVFNLLSRWEAANEEEKKVIRSKLKTH